MINVHDQAPPPATRRRLDPFGVDNGRLLNEFFKCMTSTPASAAMKEPAAGSTSRGGARSIHASGSAEDAKFSRALRGSAAKGPG